MSDSIKQNDKTIATLERAVEHARSFLLGLDDRSVAATADAKTLHDRLAAPLPSQGIEPEKVIDELAKTVDDGLLGSTGGRFFAWVIGGALPSALAADWLTSTWDQNAALFACSPAAAAVEEVAGNWLLELLDLPRESSFGFTTGCQMAHFGALSAARYAVLSRQGWDVNEQGLFGAPTVKVIVGEHRHASIDRAIRFLGIGSKNVVTIPADETGMANASLEQQLRNSDGPTIVVLNAADLNIAAFDSFATLIPLAKSHGAWVHIDGAFGLFARASHAKRKYVEGVELADSWATDGHKWLNVPFDCGVFFTRDSKSHFAAMGVSASYIAAATDSRDQIDWNPEWSRRARGIAVYAALRELGRDGVEQLIDRTCRHAESIVSELGNLPNVDVLWTPHLNQGLVRFLSPGANATAADHDAQTDRVIAAINLDGTAFFSGTTWRGKRAMRVSVVNWRTTDADVVATVSAAERVLAALARST